MKKITDFIINQRYLFLGLSMALAIISLIVGEHVKINYDMSRYLANDSKTKIGLDIMNENFSALSNLDIIVEDISSNEENTIEDYLANINNVSAVTKEKVDNYTKYSLEVPFKEDSEEAKAIYDDVTNYLDDYTYYTYGKISSQNKEVLPLYVIIIAVCSAMVILIIASSSYVEPFLFLFTILVAVALNKGSNIFLPSVSNITESIAAILQMALSMDYSIMLMNRYHEEKESEKDKVKAMKKALAHSFPSICSSSITTVVGLLALVFMNFKIGMDLGIVLAKGVLLSLVTILTVLPSLIIIFDKLITKTKKKSPLVKLPFMSKVSSKYHYLVTALFVIVLIVSFALKGNLTYTYSEEATDKIASLFKSNNQMAIVYENKDADKFLSYCHTLEDNSAIDEVLCYGNTLNIPLQYPDLLTKLQSYDEDLSIEDYLLKIIYYHYQNPLENNQITLDNLINFIQSDVYNNANLSKNIDNEMKKNIDRLSNFINSKEINKKRSSDYLASVLNMEEKEVNDLLTLYHAKDININVSLKELLSFMQNNASLNKALDSSSINTLLKMTSKDDVLQKLSYEEMAKFLNITAEDVKNMYLAYGLLNDIDLKLPLDVVIKTVNNEELNQLLVFTNKELITKEMIPEEMQTLIPVDLSMIKMIYTLNNKELLSPYDFITFVINNNLSTNTSLPLISLAMNSALNNEVYTYQELASLIPIEEDTLKSVYAYLYVDSLKLNINELTTFIISNKDNPLLKDHLSKETLNNLYLLNTVSTNTINNHKYTKEDYKKILNATDEEINLIYSLYDINVNKKEVEVSFKDFITFLNNDVMNNKDYQDKFTKQIKNNLKIVSNIINNSLNNKKYTKEEVYNTLSPLTTDLNKNLIDLLYIYYGSVHDFANNYLTVEEFINYLNDNILNDHRFDDYITEEEIDEIKDGKVTILDAKDKLVSDKYSRIVLNTSLPYEGEATYQFIEDINKDIAKLSDKAYLASNSTMSYEMNNGFARELNLITILTIIFIVIVVLFTFKSFIIPIILVLIIQTSVFLIMGILSFSNEPLYFISILIVQSILMGATIDYAILYTSYYLEERKNNDIKMAINKAYEYSLHTILTSASILTIVTLIVGVFSSAIASKICTTLSEGAICSSFLIIFLLPGLLATFDKLIVKKK